MLLTRVTDFEAIPDYNVILIIDYEYLCFCILCLCVNVLPVICNLKTNDSNSLKGWKRIAKASNELNTLGKGYYLFKFNNTINVCD